MVYLDNTTETQKLFIPRDIPLVGTGHSGGAEYFAGDNIYISPDNVISVTGMTEAISAATEDMATETWVNEQGFLTEHQSLSAYSTTEEVQQMISGATEDFVTSGDVHSQIVEETANFVNSGTVETMITSATQDMATETWVNNQGFLTEHQSLSAYSTTNEVESMITAATDGLASETYVDNSVSGKADTSAVTEAISSATSGLASTQYVENAVSGKASTQYVDNAVSGKADTSAVTEEISSAVSGLASTQYVDNSVSGKADTSAVTESINNAVSGLASTQYVDNSVSGKADTSAVTESINNAVSGLASTQYVDNSVSGKADTSAVTEALSSYTPTSGFATINGSAITEGGNIEIQGGGDSTALEEITELPENPVDGAIYNYNGAIIKYVNGSGNWGYWTGLQSIKGYGQSVLGCATLFYAVMPSSMDGQLAFGTGWIKSSSADTNVQLWAFFDLQNNAIKVYNNKDKTGSTLYTIVKNAGSETQINNNYNKINVSWNDNVLQIRANDSNTQLLRYCDATSSTAHYELVKEPKYNYENTISNIDSGYNTPVGRLAIFSRDNRVVTPGVNLSTQTIYVNNSSYGNALTYYGTSKPISNMYVPTSAGNSGDLCVSQGQNNAPQWKTIVQALGIDFWTGTQDEYDAIVTKSATTLYIIIPDE